MKRKIPVSPFSTGLSGSAKEMETRIRNILTGGHKRPALLVMAGAAVMIALCGVTVFCFAQAAGGRIENPDPAWFAEYYSQDYGTRVYWWEDQPDAPQAHDVRLDAITYLGQTELEGGRIGAAYQVEKSGYDSQMGTLRWSEYEPGIEVAAWTSGGEWLGILGSPNFSVQGLATEQIIRQVDWHLLNWEVSLWRDGCSQPVGIGTQVEGILKPGEEEQTIQPLGEEFAAPIYGEGDHYALVTCGDLLAANCYYSAAEDRYSANHITCESPELYTPRGIRVGSSREAVEEAYPEIQLPPFGSFQGDYLWYQPGNTGFGPAIVFLFQKKGTVSDQVQTIMLVDLVD